MTKISSETERIRNDYDKFALNLPFWYFDAFMSGATENSRYRKKAIEILKIRPNFTVLHIACGMGPSFKHIKKYLENTEKLFGLDISANLLKRARGTVNKNQWKKIKLVNTSIHEYSPSFQFDAIICAFAMEIIPDHEETVKKIYDILKPGGNFVMIGMQLSTRFPFSKFNRIIKNLYSKYDINIQRNFISLFKQHSMVIKYFSPCHFEFEYILCEGKKKKLH